MSNECTHTLSSGHKCHAPAANGSNSFCRHHDPQRPLTNVEEESRENEPLLLPPLVDRHAMLAALNLVVQALAGGRIKRSVATTLLSAIKLANRLLTEIAEAGETLVRSNGCPQPAPQQSALNHATSNKGTSGAQAKSILAASREKSTPVAIFNSDRLVEEMMAQAHDRLAGQPRPDPKFLSI